MALKTDNTQESRQFNPTSGEYNYLTKTGSLTLSQDNEQVAIPNGSSLMVVDLGITIDRSDAQITVGGNVLEVLYFVSKSDLVGVELGTGKCAILTEEPNFRTVIYLDIAQLNKSMSYQVSSLNNSLPSYELNDIARQLNSIGGSPVIPDTGNILDGGTADFRVQLTNTNTTRTLANGEVLGQTATLFNSTANTITVTDGSFTFTVLANDKREVQWNGTKWKDVRLYKGIVYKQYQELFAGAFSFVETSTPWFFYGTVQADWQMMFEDSGAYERIEGGSPVNQIDPATGLREGEIPSFNGKIKEFISGYSFLERAAETEGIIFRDTETSGMNGIQGRASSQSAPIGIDATLQNSGTAEDPFYPYVEGAKYNEVRNVSTRLYKYVG